MTLHQDTSAVRLDSIYTESNTLTSTLEELLYRLGTCPLAREMYPSSLASSLWCGTVSNALAKSSCMASTGFIFKVTILAKPAAAKSVFLICLVDEGLDMLSNIYDSIKAIKCILVVLWLKTSTHYQGAVLLTKWHFVYIFICKQST